MDMSSRGSDDNKSAAVGTLFLLRCLRELGIDPGCNVKVFCGCDEEYSRIVTPSEMKIINAANEVSNHNILHMCSWAGNPNHLSYWKDYPLCVKNWGCGVEGVSMAEGKELFEGAVLLGGMDNRRDHPLYAGTREEIQSAVADVLRQMDGTPFLMGADCTVPPDIDFDHIRWVLEALRA